MIPEELVDSLAREVPPQAAINFRPSPQNQARFNQLVEQSKRGCISRDEQRELDQYVMLEHVMQQLKAKARARQLRDTT